MSASTSPPSKASLRAWWRQFTTHQKMKRPPEDKEKDPPSRVFSSPLKESLGYASVQISTANANGELYVWGYIPVVVAKCGLYLKENATEVPGTFRVSGSTKRMKELQAKFENPPRYGKSLDLKDGQYTTHDVASVLRRYLTSMPEPVIPHELYHEFREALSKTPFNQDDCIQTYKRLIRSMPRANQFLLLYVLDLLSVFARKSEKNLMTATNLAVIFRPGLIAHPDHELSPPEHQLSQQVLEFLIAHQDWFMLDIPPAPSDTNSPLSPASDDVTDMVMPSDEEGDTGGWRLVERRGRGTTRGDDDVVKSRTPRRRTTSAGDRPSNPSSPLPTEGDNSGLTPVNESQGSEVGKLPDGTVVAAGTGTSVTRSRTLPPVRTRGEGSGSTSGSEGASAAPRAVRNVLKKGGRGARTSVVPSQR